MHISKLGGGFRSIGEAEGLKRDPVLRGRSRERGNKIIDRVQVGYYRVGIK